MGDTQMAGIQELHHVLGAFTFFEGEKGLSACDFGACFPLTPLHPGREVLSVSLAE